MKKLLISTAAMLVSASIAQADPVEGRWSTQPDDNGNTGVIHVSTCGDRICGTLIESRRGDGSVFQSDNNGRQIIWDMMPTGNGEYRDGQIYSPDRDQTYRSRMTLAGDSLTVEGCVLIICRGQTWTRLR